MRFFSHDWHILYATNALICSMLQSKSKVPIICTYFCDVTHAARKLMLQQSIHAFFIQYAPHLFIRFLFFLSVQFLSVFYLLFFHCVRVTTYLVVLTISSEWMWGTNCVSMQCCSVRIFSIFAFQYRLLFAGAYISLQFYSFVPASFSNG